MKKKRKVYPLIALTGKELKFAAEHKLKVRYMESYLNPMDSHNNFKGVCIMEPANVGYYIGESDIVPEDFKDTDIVTGEFPEGTYGVYKVPGVKYSL